MKDPNTKPGITPAKQDGKKLNDSAQHKTPEQREAQQRGAASERSARARNNPRSR